MSVGEKVRSSGGAGVALHRVVAWVALIGLLALAASRNQLNINVDAVAYLRVAEYYVNGNWALAVNGYWGPMLSWIMGLFLVIGAEPMQAARAATAAGGVVYFLGAWGVARAFGLRGWREALAVWPVALFCVYWSVAVITPDLLMSGLMLLGISLAVGAGASGGGWRSLGAGAVYGLAFLAKAVALPVSLLLAVLIPGLRAVSGACDPVRSLKRGLLTLAGIAVIAGPWIAVLSVHYGAPTFSTSGAIGHAIVGPPGVERSHPTFRTYHAPEPGRVTSWEDPSRMPYARWSLLDSGEAFVHQMRLVYWNADRVLRHLKGLDWAGLGIGVALAGFLAGLAGWQWARQGAGWMALPVVGALVAIYLPVYADDLRYYLTAFAVLLASSLATAAQVAGGPAAGATDGSRSVGGRWLAVGAVLAVVVSFGEPQISGVKEAMRGLSDPSYEMAGQLREVLESEHAGGQGIASVGSRPDTAYYLAFLAGRPFHGHKRGEGGEVSVDEVVATGADTLVVDSGSAAEAQVEKDGRFERIGIAADYGSGVEGAGRAALYRLRDSGRVDPVRDGRVSHSGRL